MALPTTSIHSTDTISVVVVWSPAGRQVVCQAVRCAVGTTAQQALRAAFAIQGKVLGDVEDLTLAIWNRKATAQTVLSEGDRLELLRPLKVDPKIARQRRFDRQGRRGTGLFRLKATRSRT